MNDEILTLFKNRRQLNFRGPPEYLIWHLRPSVL